MRLKSSQLAPKAKPASRDAQGPTNGGDGMTDLDKIKVPAAFCAADQADFYRRGWRDGELGRAPANMDGYPAALKLAYIAGGMDANTK